MIFFLGAISLVQIFVLPGLALLLLTEKKVGFIKASLLVVLLSILFNFILVWMLVVLGAYNQTNLFVIIVIEIALIVYGVYKSFPRVGAGQLRNQYQRQSIIYLSALDMVVAAVCLFIAYAAIFWWAPNLGGPFLRADPNVIWNAWAKVWVSGRMPGNTSGYPQLIPELWSLVYVMSGGAEIQSFARSVNSFFPWFGILGLALLIETKQKIAFVLASLIILPLWFLTPSFSPYVFHGFAEFPLASFILLFSVALMSRNSVADADSSLIHIAGLAAILAATTKLNGVFLCVALPMIVFVQDFKFTGNRDLKLASIYGAVGTLFSITWFVYFLGSLGAGQEEYRQFTAIPSSFSDLLTYILGATKPAMDAWNRFGPFITSAAVLIFLASLFDKKLWPFAVFIVLPFIAFWLIFLWYGVRNALHTTGLLSLMLSVLIGRHLPTTARRWLDKKSLRASLRNDLLSCLRPIMPVAAFAFATLALLALYAWPPMSDDDLARSEEDLKWTMGGVPARINKELMASFPVTSQPTKVFTNHWPVFVLESQAQIDFHWTPGFRRPANLLDRWIKKHPDGYVLLSKRLSNEIREYTDRLVSAGQFDVIYRNGTFVLLAPSGLQHSEQD